MKEMFRKAKVAFWLNIMAVLWFCFFSFNALWTCWTTAMNNVDPDQMTRWDWFNTLGGCFSAWCVTMMAFIFKASRQLSEGHLPGLDDVDIKSGDTVEITKT